MQQDMLFVDKKFLRSGYSVSSAVLEAMRAESFNYYNFHPSRRARTVSDPPDCKTPVDASICRVLKVLVSGLV